MFHGEKKQWLICRLVQIFIVSFCFKGESIETNIDAIEDHIENPIISHQSHKYDRFSKEKLPVEESEFFKSPERIPVVNQRKNLPKETKNQRMTNETETPMKEIQIRKNLNNDQIPEKDQEKLTKPSHNSTRKFDSMNSLSKSLKNKDPEEGLNKGKSVSNSSIASDNTNLDRPSSSSNSSVKTVIYNPEIKSSDVFKRSSIFFI